MNKTRTTVYTNENLVHLAKAKGINMSQLFTEALEAALGVDVDPRPRIMEIKAELHVLQKQLDERTVEDWIWQEILEDYIGYKKSRGILTINPKDRFFYSWIHSPHNKRRYPVLKGMEPDMILAKLEKMESEITK